MPSESRPQASALARRVHGWSCQAFPVGMGTGAVYVTLSDIKEGSRTLTTIETIFFFLNIALFLLNTMMLTAQAILYPRQAWRFIRDPVKGVFMPLVVLSFATIIIGIINYAFPMGHVSIKVLYALFWVYVALALVTCFPMLMIWFNNPHDLNKFSPNFAFLIFPMMLVGVVSFNILQVMNPSDARAVGVLFVGYFFQGLGFFMTFIYIIIYIIRIMITGFMDGSQANSAFVTCGPPGFTALALINLGVHAQEILDIHGLVTPRAGEVWYAASVMCALMLYGLAMFLFLFSVLPYCFKLHQHLNEIVGCWALTFPNVGWINATRVLGDTLNISGFRTVHLIMTIIMLMIWCILIVLTTIAFWKGLIFFSKEEDVLRDAVYVNRVSRLAGEKNRENASNSAHQSQETLVFPSHTGMHVDPNDQNMV
ncbi:hypothetical protein VKT23_012380 [Stygiomarasmius scandens]|uniref:Malic acid transport protein n=1 Tax=Marasmiellus scandens TaxID=2682957 RepID=A0ABR1J6D6_9AGAR